MVVVVVLVVVVVVHGSSDKRLGSLSNLESCCIGWGGGGSRRWHPLLLGRRIGTRQAKQTGKQLWMLEHGFSMSLPLWGSSWLTSS